MDEDEVVSDTQSPCAICQNLTFNAPNWDGTVTCGVKCTDHWIEIYLDLERTKWESLREEVRAEMIKMRARIAGLGSH